MNEHELHELHESFLEEHGWLSGQGLHEWHELFKERRLEDDAIFFQSLWVAEVEQEA